MRTLYRALLRLYPAQVRDEFGGEMLAVFDEASANAKSRGAVAWVAFALREMAGLVHGLITEGDFMIKHGKWMLRGALAGLALALAFGWAVARQPFTSSAVIRSIPPQIPDRFVPASVNIDVRQSMPALMQTVMARKTLADVINRYNLYPGERERMPMEDVVEVMRKALRFRALDESTLSVGFSYDDRKLAQQVTADVVSRMIVEHAHQRTMNAALTAQFLKDRVTSAAFEWQESVGKLRAASKTSADLDRLQLDSEVARKRYMDASERLAEARTAEEMERRRQGAMLEILDPASLPADTRLPVWLYGAGGALAGGLLGLLLSVAGRVARGGRRLSEATV